MRKDFMVAEVSALGGPAPLGVLRLFEPAISQEPSRRRWRGALGLQDCNLL